MEFTKMRLLKSEEGSGATNMVWLAGLAALVYFGIMYVPPYVEQYEVKQVLREAANQAYRERSDDKLRSFIQTKCKQIGSHYEIRDGEERNLPGIVLLDDNIFVTRDETAQSIILQVEYEKHIYFPFTKKQRLLRFSPSVKGDLTPVQW
ncbi:MAG TPA: hypothetical protein DFS52_30785 [Myxococcales bacterium]|nr:hypothetical protein [Myxococcales bacterium]